MDKHPVLHDQIIDGRYRVDSFIGSGGMAVVWSATQLRTGQRVALKLILDLASRSQVQVQRLLREARATSAIHSRHVVRIVDVHPEYQHEGLPLPFVVMEFLEGINLAQYLDSCGPLSEGQVVWLIAQVCQGLSSAHMTGVVHRDLKPANVFIAEEDERNCVIKVCDFGIAKVSRDFLAHPSKDESLVTETGALLGTPRYMAPEQLRHTTKQGPATDQWAVALVAYAALTGRSYFESARNGVELVLAISQDTLERPSTLSNRFPEALDSWFLRSCAREPSLRYDDVDAQYSALSQALSHIVPEPIPIAELRAAKLAQLVEPTAEAPPLTPNEGPRRRFSGPIRISWSAQFGWLIGLSTALAALGLYVLPRIAMRYASVPSAGDRARASKLESIPGPESRGARPKPLVANSAEITPNITANVSATVERAVAPNRDAESTPTRNRREVRAQVLPSTAPRLLAAGAVCQRSAQCQSQLCLAETCQ